MLKEEFLSQEEIDALLKGVTNEVDEEPVAADPSGVRTYNLGSQERIVRGRMPTLEIINERFARNWRLGLFNFMRRNAEISVGPVKVQKYSEFIRNLVVPAAINLVHVKPLRGTALFVFDPNLIFLVVDNLFGGDGRFHMRVEGRDFTDVEQRIIQRMLQLMFDHYAKAWQPIYPIEFEQLRMEMHTEFANVATPNEVVPALPSTAAYVPKDHARHPDYIPLPPLLQAVPKQERGVRPARALPYELFVRGRHDEAAAKFQLDFVNTGDVGAAFLVYTAGSVDALLDHMVIVLAVLKDVVTGGSEQAPYLVGCVYLYLLEVPAA